MSHSHQFHQGNPVAERGTRLVMWLTLVMMCLEIGAGWWFQSMALLADGWHMSSHALAIGLSAFAYAAARRLADDPRFAFGTWKIEILGGYTSAIALLAVAFLMALGSMERLFHPADIQYREAIAIAILGLAVNVISAWVLGHAHDAHGHHHGEGHSHHHHGDHHHDLNLRSAYLHVLADAATSVLAILALLGGWLWGWNWLDPVMGLVGAVLVGVWARQLLLDTGRVLLDAEMDAPVVEEIREVISAQAEPLALQLTDLHVWRVGRGSYACTLALETSDPGLSASDVRRWLSIHEELVHVIVEIQHRQ